MESLKILNTREKKKILEDIRQRWGADFRTDLVFLLSNKSKIYLINKDLQMLDEKKLNIDRIGLYFGEMNFGGLRLTIEGSQLVGPYAKKNVLEISNGEAKIWLHGNNLLRKEMKSAHGFLIIKNNNDFIGCGKAKQGEVMNFVPKTRRILSSE